MGWFDEQIRERKQRDADIFTDSLVQIAGAVMGKRISEALSDDRIVTKTAIDEILKYYHVKTRELPENMQDINEQLEYLLRPYGIMRRTVQLSEGWYRDASGAMLGSFRTGGIAALLPEAFGGYRCVNPKTGESFRIGRRNQALLDAEAIAFYKPFPVRQIGLLQFVRYILEILQPSDYAMVALSTLAVSLIGMFLPKLNSLLFGTVLASGSPRLLAAAAVFMICVTISSTLMTTVKNILTERLSLKTDFSLQAASMMRILSLPADFFKQYSAGELSARAQYINQLGSLLISAAIGTGLTSVFSLLYVSQIFIYAPGIVVPALLVTLATLLLSVLSSLLQMRITARQMELFGKSSGLSYALISGVQKIKLSGAEKRAFAKWGSLYAEQARLSYNPPAFLKLNTVFQLAISLTGTIVIYYAAVKSRVSVADYYAFHTAYGMVSGAFLSLSGIALSVAQLRPILEMVKPILETKPEIAAEKQVVSQVSGGIELSSVSFRYSESMPLLLNELSLKIRLGQYVAIVGKTGCGKSTLLRLLLGFERPQKGAIYYDGKDLQSMDLKSLRRRIGVVMQNGKLFQGDIYSNIVISAPWLGLEAAWEAAELAGIAEDIRRMPMGMHTMISEGSGGISGGQRQRLMIARAIAPKPKILMFDEATSALDNLTQKRVSESLDKLKCTRIVIAHRLSTIRQCDRILVLDQGKIIEDGSYEELLARKGYFAELVARQRLDSAAS